MKMKKYYWLILAALAVLAFFYFKRKKRMGTVAGDTKLYVDRDPLRVPQDQPPGVVVPGWKPVADGLEHIA
jgi:hypothetical protein